MMQEVQLPSIIEVYLDSLTDEERDRVIAAREFKVGGGYVPPSPGKPATPPQERTITKQKRKQERMDLSFRPIPGTQIVETKTFTIMDPGSPATPPSEPAGCLIDHAKAGTSTDQYSTVGTAFDNFYRTHGDKAIRAIKMYAARLNKIELPTEHEHEEWEQVEAPSVGREVRV